MNKKILIFSTTFHPFVGGAEVAIKEICSRVKEVDFDMLTLRFDSALPAFEKQGNINIYRLGFTKKNPNMSDLSAWPLKLNKLLFPFLSLLKAWQLGRQKKYDLIWAMMAAYAGFGAMLYKYFNPKVKFLLSLQEGDPIDEIKSKVAYVYPIFRRIFKSADYIQVISHHLANFAKGMGYTGPIKVIPNGVDIKLFSKKITDIEALSLKKNLDKVDCDVFLITTSRLVAKNGINDLVESLKFLPENYKLLVLGLGPDFEKLQGLAKELDLGERIHWLGFVEQTKIPEYLQVSDIFIRPSLSEGLGNSFLEAMAAGVPVIATPVGGIPDFLFDPERNPDKPATGLFCLVKNPQNIALSILKIIENPELKNMLIKNGQELVAQKYEWDFVGEAMEKLFKEISTKKEE